MKKIILPLLIVLLFGISIYTVVDHNKNKSADSTITKEETTKENNTTTDSTTEKESTSDTDTSSDNDSSTDEGATDKIAALDFKLKDLNGKEVSLSDFKGKKVFLNFWASWCPPCKAEMPDIEKVYQETKDSDLVILAVNVGESRDVAKSFLDDNKLNFTALLDSDKSVDNQYQLVGYPTSYFIDTEGNIVSKQIGYMTLEEMKAHISEL